MIAFGFKLGYSISKEIDRGAIELLGPKGLSNYFYNTANNFAKLDTGVITSYALYILVGLTFYLLFPYLFFIDTNLLIIILFGLLSITKTKIY